MNKSGIIYPDPNDTFTQSGYVVAKSGDGFLRNNSYLRQADNSKFEPGGLEKVADLELQNGISETNSDYVIPVNSDIKSSFESHSDVESGADFSGGSGGNSSVFESWDNNKRRVSNRTSDEHQDFEIRRYANYGWEKDLLQPFNGGMQESPFKTQSDKPRKFATSRSHESDGKYKHFENDKVNELLTARQESIRKGIESMKKSGRNSVASGDNQRTIVSERSSNSRSKTKFTREKISNISAQEHRNQKSDLEDESVTERSSEKKEKSESVFLNLMFVFEIFRWFTGSDIIVRFIIGAIAGVVGFGFMFSSMGLLNSF